MTADVPRVPQPTCRLSGEATRGPSLMSLHRSSRRWLHRNGRNFSGNQVAWFVMTHLLVPKGHLKIARQFTAGLQLDIWP